MPQGGTGDDTTTDLPWSVGKRGFGPVAGLTETKAASDTLVVQRSQSG